MSRIKRSQPGKRKRRNSGHLYSSGWRGGNAQVLAENERLSGIYRKRNSIRIEAGLGAAFVIGLIALNVTSPLWWTGGIVTLIVIWLLAVTAQNNLRSQ